MATILAQKLVQVQEVNDTVVVGAAILPRSETAIKCFLPSCARRIVTGETV